MPESQTVNMVGPDGDLRAIPVDQVAMAAQSGFRVENADEHLQRVVQGVRDERTGGVTGTVAAGVTGALRGATLGLSDVVLGIAVGGDEYAFKRGQELREAHPGASLAGELAGAVATAIPSGGASLERLGASKALGAAERLAAATPSGMVARAGARIAETAEGSSLGARAVAGVKAGAFEGAAQGAGGYVSDVALGDKELSADGFVAAMGKGALFGGAAGGALTAGAEGLVAARRLFPKQEITREAVQVANTEARKVVQEAVGDADTAVTAARQRMRDIREQHAAMDLATKAELDGIAVAKARELADAQVATARARQAKAEAPPAARRGKKAKGEPEPAPDGPASAPVEAPRVRQGEPAAPSVQTKLEEQLGRMKTGLDGGDTLQGLNAKRLKPTHVEDALNEAIGKVNPEVETIARAVAEVDDSRDAVGRWLEKYGGKQGNVGRFERGEASRATADSWRSKQPGYYNQVPAGEGNAGLSRGRESVFRGSEDERIAAETAFYAKEGDRSARDLVRQGVEPRAAGGREALDDAERLFPGGMADEVPLDKQLADALGTHTDDFDVDVSDLADAVGRMERAQADLADALGPGAPLGAQARAHGYREAERAAEKSATQASVSAVEDAEKAATTIGLPSQAGGKLGAASRAMQAGDALEAAQMLGLPVPDVGKIPVIGPVLQAVLRARVMAKAFGRFGGKTAETAETVIAGKAARVRERVYTAVDKMLEVGARGVRAAAPVAGGTAAILGDKLFDDGTKTNAPKKGDLLANYEARRDELARATPDAIRTAVRDKVRTNDPAVLDAIVKAKQRKLDYYAKMMPRPGEPDGLLGGMPWVPSRGSLAEWATTIEAGEDPAGVLERISKGGIAHPAAIDAIKTIYPSLYADAQKRLLTQMTNSEVKVPYARRVAIAALFDIPVDHPPGYGAWVQQGYAQKAAPPAQPPMPGAGGDVQIGARTDPSL